WIFERLNWSGVLRYAALAAIIPGLMNLNYRVLPLIWQPDWREAQRVANWYEASELIHRFPRVMASHPGTYFFLGISPTNSERTLYWDKENLRRRPPG